MNPSNGFTEASGQARSLEDANDSLTRENQQQSDEILMARWQTGDTDALEQLYARYCRLMLGVSTRILRDSEEAKEVVQEVFFYLFRARPVFDSSKSTVRSWLVQITYKRAFHRLEHLKAKCPYRGSSERVLPSVADLSMTDPERLAILTAWRLALFEAIDKLSREQRSTILLYFFSGYTLLEISERIRKPIENVKHYYFRGLDQLRKRHAKEWCHSWRGIPEPVAKQTWMGVGPVQRGDEASAS